MAGARIAAAIVAITSLFAVLLIGSAPVQATAPAPPTGCSGPAEHRDQTTPVAIPDGPVTVTSTIDVAGAAPRIADVDLTTFLTHTFAADLDMTLTSPAGTVVTLTTDNGAPASTTTTCSTARSGTTTRTRPARCPTPPTTASRPTSLRERRRATPLVARRGDGGVHRRGPQRHVDDHDLRRPGGDGGTLE